MSSAHLSWFSLTHGNILIYSVPAAFFRAKLTKSRLKQHECLLILRVSAVKIRAGPFGFLPFFSFLKNQGIQFLLG